MSDTFDFARATDRGYSPPLPWTLWHFEKMCWTCMVCEAPASSQLHAPTCWLDDDNSVEDCKNKFSEIRQRELAGGPVFGAVPVFDKKSWFVATGGTKTVTLMPPSEVATPTGKLSDAPITPMSQVAEFEFPMPAVRCSNCPRGPSPVGPDGTWMCATCGAKAGPWRAVKQPEIHITNHYDSEQVIAALSSEDGQRMIRNALTRHDRPWRECNHMTFEASCGPDPKPNPPVWLVIIVTLLAIGVLAALAWALR